MNTSALASALDNLEKSWSSLDWWLNFWTLMVVIGVAVELLVLVTEYVHGWRDFKRAVIHSPDKPSLLIFSLGFLGAGLVAIGVAGELRIHTDAGRTETGMRDKTRQLVAIIEGEAAKANERASQNEQRAAELVLENQKLERSVALANERAAKSAKVAQDEAVARLQLEERIAPRRITEQEAAKIVETLKPFVGTRFVLSAVMNDAESGEYAFQLYRTFKAAGWNCIGEETRPGPCINLNAYEAPAPTGVWITGNPILPLAQEQKFSETAKSLQRTLSLLTKTKIRLSRDPRIEIGGLAINVGFKPQPTTDASNKP